MPWLASVPGWIWIGLAFIYGAIIGSFLNVLIYRLPRGEEVVKTPSHCPSCGAPIPFYLNIPIISWLILRGKAVCCGARIKIHYFLIELACASLTAYLFAQFGLSFEFLSTWILSCLLLVLLVTDWQTMRLPDVLTLPGALLGLIFAAAGVRTDLIDALLGIGVGAGGFLGIALLYRATRGQEGMGMGDVKLMAMVGAFLGWHATLLVVVLGSILGLVAGIVFIVFSGGGAKTKIPFGSFLCVAALLVMLWGGPILGWYAGLLSAGNTS